MHFNNYLIQIWYPWAVLIGLGGASNLSFLITDTGEYITTDDGTYITTD